jgi:hypothetical protein
VPVHNVDRHLDRFPAIEGIEQPLMHRRIVVAGEPDVANLPLLLGFDKRLQCTTRAEDLVHLILSADLMALPEIEVVGTHPLQRFFELFHG